MAGYIGSKAVTLSTTAADVTGNAIINGDLTVKGTTLTVDSAAAQEIRLGDNDKLTFGDATGGDLQIYHDGFNSYIDDVGTGGLIVRADNFYVRKANDVENMIIGSADGAVTLYHDNATKLATTTTGVDITGTLTSDGLTVEGSGYSSLKRTGTINSDAVFDLRSDNGVVFRGSKNGDISFYEDTGTTAKFFWDASAESLGIGTTTPAAPIDALVNSTAYVGRFVQSNTANGDGVLVQIGSTASSDYALTVRSDGGNTPVLSAKADGNVGIGTFSPSEKLEVSGTGHTRIQVTAGTSSDAAIYLGDSGDADAGAVIYDNAPNALKFRANGSERMRINSSGNVGIGTSSPSNKLHVQSSGSGTVALFGDSVANNYLAVTRTTTNPAYVGLHATSNVGGLVAGTTLTLSTSAADGTSVTERMRINSSGALLVGKTADNLTDAGQVFTTAGSSFTRSGGAVCQFNRNTSDGEIVRLSKDGTTVGSIRTVGADIAIESSNNQTGLRFRSVAITPEKNSSAANGTVDLGETNAKFKDAHFSGTVNAANFNTTSDATLKTNVETLTGSLDAVKALRGVSYEWIDNGNSEVGVIAQEVEEVIPDVVSTNDQGIKSVKYGNLVGVLIEAIKEQQQRIEALEAQLNS
jgi:hypothetical protein